MCGNWNSKKALKSLAQGKYLERSRPDADNNMTKAIQSQNLGINAKTSNSIMGDRMKLQARPNDFLSRNNHITNKRPQNSELSIIETRQGDREINSPQERALYAN